MEEVTPYAPPQAAVADVAPVAPTLARPNPVTMNLWVLWTGQHPLV